MARKKANPPADVEPPKGEGKPRGTKPRQFRLGDETLAKIDALGRLWGGTIDPTNRSAVIRRTVDQAWDREFGGGKKSEK